MINITLKKNFDADNSASAILINDNSDLASIFSGDKLSYVQDHFNSDQNSLTMNELGKFTFVVKVKNDEDIFKYHENLRIAGYDIFKSISSNSIETIQVKDLLEEDKSSLLFAEGLALSTYKFDKYMSDKKEFKLTIEVVSETISEDDIHNLNGLVKATFIARDYVNEPQSYLNTVQYSIDLEKHCNEFGITYSKFDKEKIEELKMGGLLAVNQGSLTPPVFNILEYKPENAVNEKPLIFIGKGVVYDTGGLSLKPTPNSMDFMKSDMGGSAAVAGAIYAIAQSKLPVHVITLIAATDNRPGGDAYAPGDVITMYNGKTVEVLNTDAEGRLTLGDALTYADELNPELVIDLATLTGAAARAIGKQASVAMGNAPAEIMLMLQESGMKTYERLVEFPLFDEYKEDMKSGIADIKNIGGAEAGATTAGIFLQEFVESPWIHIDIAGTAYLFGDDKYRSKFGTGVGVRLLYQFVKDYYNVG